MFRIVCDPSSGTIELYLTDIRSGSLMFVVCLIGVWQLNFEPVVCVYGTTGWELVPKYIFARTSPLLFRNEIVANESWWQCNYVYLFVITKSFREEIQFILNSRKYPHWDILTFQRASRKCH